MSQHVVLLGDSIFDNQVYTGGEPDVVSHLRSMVPTGWEATLLAVDGSTTADLPGQIARLPKAASHLVASVGGNDALGHSDLLILPARSVRHALWLLADRIAQFEASYRAALGVLLARGLPTTICTIYNGNFLDPDEATLIRVAVAAFNDVILRNAFEHGVPVIELRLVCTDPEDYANPIEPSGRGGHKIAGAIAAAVGARGPSSRRTTVWPG
jgi:GDSL-like Lipase/Acylhydrolase family